MASGEGGRKGLPPVQPCELEPLSAGQLGRFSEPEGPLSTLLLDRQRRRARPREGGTLVGAPGCVGHGLGVYGVDCGGSKRGTGSWITHILSPASPCLAPKTGPPSHTPPCMKQSGSSPA